MPTTECMRGGRLPITAGPLTAARAGAHFTRKSASSVLRPSHVGYADDLLIQENSGDPPRHARHRLNVSTEASNFLFLVGEQAVKILRWSSLRLVQPVAHLEGHLVMTKVLVFDMTSDFRNLEPIEAMH